MKSHYILFIYAECIYIYDLREPATGAADVSALCIIKNTVHNTYSIHLSKICEEFK